jgi:uncharacterized membrane protein
MEYVMLLQATAMQRTNKYLHWLIRASGRLWAFLLLAVSVTILILPIFGIPSPSLLVLFFSLFIPGYAFVALVFSRLNMLEKTVASIALSLGLLVGIRSFIETFGYVGLFSELDVLEVFSTILLTAKLLNDFFVKKI